MTMAHPFRRRAYPGKCAGSCMLLVLNIFFTEPGRNIMKEEVKHELWEVYAPGVAPPALYILAGGI
jgi:hypothetical protein